MRIALVLLFLLAVASVPGSVLPREGHCPHWRPPPPGLAAASSRAGS